MIHVTYTSELWHIYEWFMSHMQLSHGIYTNDSCHVYIWVMAHIWMIRVTYTAELWHIYEWFMSRIHLSYGTYMNDSCHVYIWVMAHIWMIRVTYTSELWHIYEWCMSQSDSYHTHEWVMGCWPVRKLLHPLCLWQCSAPLSRAPFARTTPRPAHRYLRHDSFTYMRNHFCMWHGSWIDVPKAFGCGPRRVTPSVCARTRQVCTATCVMTHLSMYREACLYVTWRDVCMCVTWLIHVCYMTHLCVYRDACMYVTWLIHVCCMTHSYLRHHL